MKKLLSILMVVAAITATADSSLTTATENKALYATTIATTATVGGTLGVTGAFTATTNATIGGLLLQPTHSITASTALTTAHQFVLVYDQGGDVVLTLPDPTTSTNYNLVLMKRAGSNRTTYTSTALIDGIANTMPLPLLEAVTLRSNGTQWFIVSAAQNNLFTQFTTNVTLTVGDTRNSYNDASGNITVNLPSATNYSTLGRIYWHKKYGGGNTTTLTPSGSQTIDGASTLALQTIGAVGIYSDLSNWRTIASSAMPVALSSITGLGTGVGTLLAGTPSGTGGVAGTVAPTFTGTITSAGDSTNQAIVTTAAGLKRLVVDTTNGRTFALGPNSATGTDPTYSVGTTMVVRNNGSTSDRSRLVVVGGSAGYSTLEMGSALTYGLQLNEGSGLLNIQAAGGAGLTMDSSRRVAISESSTTPDTQASLDLQSTARPLKLNRMTAAVLGAIASPGNGLIAYQTDGTPGVYVANGTTFTRLENAVTENTQTGTTYTITSSDNGKVVTFDNASAITVTVPALSAAFRCRGIQKGAGKVTFTSSGTTINNRSGYSSTAGQYAEVALYGTSSTTFILSGDTGP